MPKPKLFIFAIGGTGSRVIKSLSFLLAAGAEINASEIIPIIVDPDRANGDMNRTVDILKYYQRIREVSHSGFTQFFNAKIATLNELVSKEAKEKFTSPDFRLELNGVQNERFRDFIDYNNLDAVNRQFTNLLFSEENLDSDMEVGFKGNPNIGSVVLNQFKDSNEFKHFASNFEENDRIFIISSIFGGTGAAGFPLILKNIRNASDKLSNWAFLREAKIGAISILPYFGVESDDNSKIDKATFISKAKAALSYYSRNISGNNSVNALYYIGDDQTKNYDNQQGAAAQRNDAHFVEVASALAVIDFMNLDDKTLATQNGQALNPVYKEFGIKEDSATITSQHLGTITQKTITRPLTQFQLLNMFLRDKIEDTLNKHPWSNAGKIKIDKNFTTSAFYSDWLRNFNKHFTEWLNELNRNKVAFAPFNLATGEKNVFQLVNDIEPTKSWSPIAKKNYELFLEELNDAEKKVSDLPVEQKFMGIFWQATKKLTEKKFNW
jgi:hypothetical protein